MIINHLVTLPRRKVLARCIVVGDPANGIMTDVTVVHPGNGRTLTVTPAEYRQVSEALYLACVGRVSNGAAA